MEGSTVAIFVAENQRRKRAKQETNEQGQNEILVNKQWKMKLTHNIIPFALPKLNHSYTISHNSKHNSIQQ